MRKLRARVLAIPFALLAVTATFQNCSGGFTYDPASGNLSSSSVNDLTGVFGLRVYSAGGYAMADSMPFDPGIAYEVRATGSSTMSALLSWSLDPMSTASCVLNSTGVVTKREVKCSTQGSVIVRLQAIWPDETITYASHTHGVGAPIAPTPTPAPVDENTVVFRVRAGTGAGAWNTANTSILVFVGQNFRVYNDDTTNHRIQTNGMPFPAQTDQIVPNAFKDFAVTSAIAATNTTTFDGNAGAGARIFIESLDGDAKYAGPGGAGNVQSCASCHGGINNSNKRGSTFSGIKNAIAANRGGMASITLSDKELESIAYALNH